MSPSRNDPCPCGSGKKYKNCCIDVDAARERSLRLVQGNGTRTAADDGSLRVTADVLRSIRRDHIWELDAVPVPLSIDGDLPGRYCVVLLTANGFVLDAHIQAAPPSEPEEVAALLVGRLRQVVEQHRAQNGVTLPPPAILHIRHPEVAQHVARVLGAGTRVSCVSVLTDLDTAAHGMRQHMNLGPGMDDDEASTSDRRPGITLLSYPSVWSAWRLPESALIALFEAAARFYEAQPWRRLDNEETLFIERIHSTNNEHANGTIANGTIANEDSAGGDEASGAAWTACVMGAGGEQYGLCLYARDADFARQLTNDNPHDMLRGLEGAVITLYLDPRTELPREMQQEFKRNRWPVAGPNAYPALSTANTPAGGISLARVTLLTDALSAIARLVSDTRLLPSEKTPLAEPSTWVDSATGLTLSYGGSRSPSARTPWAVPTTLSPGGAAGGNANPAALFPRDQLTDDEIDARFDLQLAMLDRFGHWLAHGGGSAGGRLRARATVTTARHVGNAQLFIENLAFAHGVTVAALHEFHLRSFLYHWFPSKAMGAAREVEGLLASLRLFFAWLDTELIVCPWAAALLHDRDALEARIGTAPTFMAHGGESRWWSDQLHSDLYQRVMLPDPLVPDDDAINDWVGEREAALYDELVVLTLGWREAIIARGITDAAAVREHCARLQREWEQTKHPRFGKSPAAVIRQERRKAEKTERRHD